MNEMRVARNHILTWSLVIIACLSACGARVDSATRLETAKQAQAEGEYRTAMIELKNLLQDEPDNVEGRLRLGEVSLALGELEAAEKELGRAEALGASRSEVIVPLAQSLLAQRSFEGLMDEKFNPLPTDDEDTQYDLLIIRGSAFLGLDRSDEAEATFQQALKMREDRAPAYIGLARTAGARGDIALLEEFLLQAISVDPENVQTWLVQGEFELSRGNFAGAEDAFERALELPDIRPGAALTAKLGLAEAKLGVGRQDEAAVLIDELLATYPNHIHARFLHARLAYNNKEYEAAAAELAVLLNDAPEYPPAQLLMGATQLALGNLEQAERYLSAALAANPDNLVARKLLAAARVQLGEPETAFETLDRARETEQVDAELQRMLGEASLLAGDIERSLAVLEAAYAADPASRAVAMQYAGTLILADQSERALEILEGFPAATEPPFRRELLLMLAQVRNGNHPAAIERANYLLEHHPDKTLVYNLLGGIELNRNDLVAARRNFEQGLAINPESASALMNLAKLSYLEGDPAEAVATLEQILVFDDTHEGAMLVLAEIARKEGDIEKAVAWLEKAAAKNPQAVRPRFQLARYYYSMQKYESAERYAAEAAEQAPDNPTILTAYGLAQAANGKTQAAISSLLRVVQLRPESVDAHLTLARVQLEDKDFPGAKASYQKAVDLEPDHLFANVKLAELTMEDKRYEEAMQIAERLVEVYPESPTPTALKGNIFLAQERFADAVRAYEQSQAISLTRDVALRAYSARRRGDLPQPEVSLEAWLEKFPDDTPTRFVLAQEYQVQGKSASAVAEYERVLEETPDYPEALNNLAWIYQEEGDQRALETAQRAYELRPDDAAIADTLGWILVRGQDFDRGVQHLREAAQQAPDQSEIHCHLAWALAQTGDEDEARQILSELPDSGQDLDSCEEAEQLLQRL